MRHQPAACFMMCRDSQHNNGVYLKGKGVPAVVRQLWKHSDPRLDQVGSPLFRGIL